MPAICLGFLPLNHAAGRFTIYRTIFGGGITYFVRKSDMSTFFEGKPLHALPRSL
jgi:fatty acid CoA ligase FadD9